MRKKGRHNRQRPAWSSAEQILQTIEVGGGFFRPLKKGGSQYTSHMYDCAHRHTCSLSIQFVQDIRS